MTPLEAVLGSVILFLILFLVIIPFVLGRVGGWVLLASEYRLAGRFEGPRWRFQDITLRGWCSYSGCVSIGSNAEGLYINTIFWVSHPPLFIPWSELSGRRREFKLLVVSLGLVEFTAQRVPDVRITLRESLVKKIAAARAAPMMADDASSPPPWNSSAEVPQ